MKNSVNDEKKKFLPLYEEHLHFLITRAGWTVSSLKKIL